MYQRRALLRKLSIRTALALFALSVGSGWLAVSEAGAQPQDLVQLMLLEGDSVSVRFPTPICASGGFEVGAVIEGEVAESKLISSLVAIEEGAPVKVEVTALTSNGRKGKPGQMTLAFQSVIAADGAEIFFRDEAIERQGSGKHLVKKILTLFLIKGGDACVRSDERFQAKFRSTSAVYVPHP